MKNRGIAWLLGGLFVWFSGAVMADSPVVVYKAASDFDTVRENIELAVTDRGMLVSGTLHVSDMLNRTGADLGFPDNVYLKAESVEFCSAVMSHRMVQADPLNLVICPFTVAVYIKSDEPEQVYVAFRRHYLAGESQEVADAVFNLLDEIAREASE